MKITKRQLRRIIKEELQLLKEEDYDSYRDSRRERGYGGTTWKSKQAYRRKRAQDIKDGEQARAQGREDALAGKPKDPSMTHLGYIKAYDDALAELG
tara:strand:- start:205 stop:495 length:291 start_codon:yes stop_codon:yes gene_type:complete